jgi:hypothetical protein
VVDRVRYDNDLPWPQGAAGQGYSLQLIDPAQDNSRVANWSGAPPGEWRRVSTNALMTGTNLFIWLDGAGDFYLDDITLVPTTGPLAGLNVLLNPGFEDPLNTGWTMLGTNLTNSAITSDVAHSGRGSLHVVSTGSGTTAKTIIQTPMLPNAASNVINTLTFWYRLGSSGGYLTVRTYPGSALQTRTSLSAAGNLVGLATPGTDNSVRLPLEPFPSLWLNEVQPENLSGPTDNAGDRDPWIELLNTGDTPISLAGLSLADNYTNLTQWAFPSDAVINPGQFLVVWADGEPGESTETEFHTSFRLAPTNGTVVLAQDVDGARILDYFNYHGVPANSSYGAVPDGQPFYRQGLFYATPGASNNGASPPVVVYINEWMAANTSASGIADPADGDFDDWIELYNPGPAAVDLGGLYLTDTLTNQFQYRIPDNGQYVIAPGGFLLVWADNETGQNRSNRADLHVNFQLRQGGEAIGLYAADGTQIDAVTFGPQTENVSEGRYPDGVGPQVLMTTPTPRGPNLPPVQPLGSELGAVVHDPVNGTVAFSFGTEVGRQYQVEVTEDLAVPDWQPLGGTYFGTGSPILVIDELGPRPQRFYRVLLLP